MIAVMEEMLATNADSELCCTVIKVKGIFLLQFEAMIATKAVCEISGTVMSFMVLKYSKHWGDSLHYADVEKKYHKGRKNRYIHVKTFKTPAIKKPYTFLFCLK